MPLKMIQIRNVPDSLHRTLKARAALEGKSLSDYLREELERVAERPTLESLRQRLADRRPVKPSQPAAAPTRDERNSLRS